MCHDNCSCSFVEISREKLLKLCDDNIVRVNKIRKELDFEYLCHRLREINTFRRKWPWRLFLNNITVEQVDKEAKEDMWNFRYPTNSGWKTKEVAERLINAAKLAESCMIHVSTNDLLYLLK